MPLHDWNQIDAGIFHDFHTAWISEIRNALNHGVLPTDYYALAEQHAGGFIADVLTLRMPPEDSVPVASNAGAAAPSSSLLMNLRHPFMKPSMWICWKSDARLPFGMSAIIALSH
jgi:hypothetical protein